MTDSCNNKNDEEWGWFIDIDNDTCPQSYPKYCTNTEKKRRMKPDNQDKCNNINNQEIDKEEEDSNITICLMSFVTMFFIYVQLVKEMRK